MGRTTKHDTNILTCTKQAAPVTYHHRSTYHISAVLSTLYPSQHTRSRPTPAPRSHHQRHTRHWQIRTLGPFFPAGPPTVPGRHRPAFLAGGGESRLRAPDRAAGWRVQYQLTVRRIGPARDDRALPGGAGGRGGSRGRLVTAAAAAVRAAGVVGSSVSGTAAATAAAATATTATAASQLTPPSGRPRSARSQSSARSQCTVGTEGRDGRRVEVHAPVQSRNVRVWGAMGAAQGRCTKCGWR